MNFVYSYILDRFCLKFNMQSFMILEFNLLLTLLQGQNTFSCICRKAFAGEKTSGINVVERPELHVLCVTQHLHYY